MRGRHGISHPQTSAGVTALKLCMAMRLLLSPLSATTYPSLRRLFLLMAFSATHSTARPSHPQPKRNDLQAELRINILFPMKTVFLVPQYIIIIFLFNFRLRRQVKDDARLLEQVPLASGRPVSCVAVKRRWNENRILLSYAIIRCTLTCRRFFLLSTVPRSMKFPIVHRTPVANA